MRGARNKVDGVAATNKVDELRAKGMPRSEALKQAGIPDSKYYYWKERMKAAKPPSIIHYDASEKKKAPKPHKVPFPTITLVMGDAAAVFAFYERTKK